MALVSQEEPEDGAERAHRSFRRLTKPPIWVPTLYHEDVGGVVSFDYVCTLVLNALDDVQWDGRWMLSDAEVTELLNVIEKDDAWFFTDGVLHLSEILAFIAKEKNRERVLKMPGSVHGILNEAVVTDAFSQFDADKSGTLDPKEWVEFVRVLEVLHTKYLLRRAFGQFRAFFGRGQAWNPGSSPPPAGAGGTRNQSQHSSLLRCQVYGAASAAKAETRVLQLGRDRDCEGPWWNPLPPGWREDLYYYSANNHPVHGIFARDPSHRLSRMERVGMELSTIGYSLFVLRLHKGWVSDQDAPVPLLDNPMVFSLLVVILPGLVIWQLLFFLFTCPKCGLVNVSQSSRQEVRRAWIWSRAGEALGWMLLALGILYLVWRLSKNVTGSSHLGSLHVELVLGRLKGYVISWLLMPLIYFNPILAWGQPDAAKGFNLGDYIGFGQWRIEKQRFQSFSSRHLAEAGARHG
eukprot:CAMPEP_0168417930 /NCGR_PEP_ID=MMETSP0228-20121227/31505_1 /TAXON_ID=133427 /ORGANISM="Protoceratium reticulatum, Strain CCCM 535 (=CCMP 1889)" /LENGTH=462 /DNA_ID=CAMNT_0008431793 /DNA_START=71 /DNA_END=1459 /DNA_ORIENTATION=+